MMLKKLLVATAAGAMVLGGAMSASAQGSTTGNLQVKLNITNGCAFQNGETPATSGSTNATDAVLNFGNHVASETAAVIAGPASGTGDNTVLKVICTASAATAGNVQIKLDGGANGGSTGNNDRSVINGTTKVAYGLYQDAANSVPYDVDSEYTIPGLDTTGTVATPLYIYGKIAAGELTNATAEGEYTDQVIMTLSW